MTRLKEGQRFNIMRRYREEARRQHPSIFKSCHKRDYIVLKGKIRADNRSYP